MSIVLCTLLIFFGQVPTSHSDPNRWQGEPRFMAPARLGRNKKEPGPDEDSTANVDSWARLPVLCLRGVSHCC